MRWPLLVLFVIILHGIYSIICSCSPNSSHIPLPDGELIIFEAERVTVATDANASHPEIPSFEQPLHTESHPDRVDLPDQTAQTPDVFAPPEPDGPSYSDQSIRDDASAPDEATARDTIAPPETIAPPDAPSPRPDLVPDQPAPRESLPDTLQIPPCNEAQCPIVVSSFPYTDSRNTKQSTRRTFNRYNCAPNTDESGPEYIYVFAISEPGTLIAAVTCDAPTDIDIHLLSRLDSQACLIRHDKAFSIHIQPGIYYLAADTYVAQGSERSGAYKLYLHFIPDANKCGMKAEQLARIGSSDTLAMPATGLVVKEAHLLTAEEHAQNVQSGMKIFPSGWPDSLKHNIQQHYALSEQISGYKMQRTEPWAPCCEPTNHYGQGSRTKPKLAHNYI